MGYPQCLPAPQPHLAAERPPLKVKRCLRRPSQCLNAFDPVGRHRKERGIVDLIMTACPATAETQTASQIHRVGEDEQQATQRCHPRLDPTHSGHQYRRSIGRFTLVGGRARIRVVVMRVVVASVGVIMRRVRAGCWRRRLLLASSIATRNLHPNHIGIVHGDGRRATMGGQQECGRKDQTKSSGREAQDSVIAKTEECRHNGSSYQGRTGEGHDLMKLRSDHPLRELQGRQSRDQHRRRSAMNRASHRCKNSQSILPITHAVQSNR